MMMMWGVLLLLLLVVAAAADAQLRSRDNVFVGKEWSLTEADYARPQMVALHRTAIPFTVKHGNFETTSCQCGSPEKPLIGFSRTGIHLALRFFNLTDEVLFDYDHINEYIESGGGLGEHHSCMDVKSESAIYHDFQCHMHSAWPACECIMVAKEFITETRRDLSDLLVAEKPRRVTTHPYDDMDFRRWQLPTRDVIPKAWLTVEDHYFQTDATHTADRGTWMVFTSHSVVDHGEEGYKIKQRIETDGLSRIRKIISKHLMPKMNPQQQPKDEL
ncbi:protein ORF147 [Cyprinid herpesvirus 2]|uniref:Protein ORF147 n=2 Tax=Cyprinid herpesvirus 2 TaxID=317878 RepID=K7PC18_CYHV2|nr:protein ORF147 [Cyprinid herpesvirus 2]AFJ20568.1 protein ORF147 [Cyprinid herpesvirus 2]